jgi:hypothetical protein
MIGYITTQKQAEEINAVIAKAQTDRGLPVFWLVGSIPIHSGIHAGMHFVPCDDNLLSTPLIGNPPQTPVDLSEFAAIIETLGGLEARIDLAQEDVVAPKPTEDNISL